MRTNRERIAFDWYRFSQLSPALLYQLLKLRSEVFVVEQACVYPDLDDQDQSAWHLLVWDNAILAGYLRVMPLSNRCQLGRIVVARSYRGQGIASEMIQHAIEWIANNELPVRLTMMAQQHLQSFYQRFGFIPVGEPFDDAGILHINMVREV